MINLYASSTYRTNLLLCLLLYICAVVFAFHFAEAKRQAVAYNPIDYSYYLGIYSKAFSQVSPQHNINPNGLSMFGFHGTEGAKSFHQAIHIEPVKYLLAWLYALWPEPRFLLGFFPVLFFLPVLYAPIVFGPQRSQSAVCFAALYAFYPSAFQDASFDLRPFMLLAPTFVMLMLSIHFKRPLVEQVLLFLALFLVREEGLVLGAFAVTYAAATSCRKSFGYRAAWLVPLVIWMGWFVLMVSYYLWTDYLFTIYLYRIKFIERHYLIMLPLLALVGLLAAGICLWCWNRWTSQRRNLSVGIYALLVALLGLQMFLLLLQLRDRESDLDWMTILMMRICGERTHLFWSSLLVLAVMARAAMPSGFVRYIRMARWPTVVICLLLLGWPAFWSPLGAYRSFCSAIPGMAPLWELRAATDPQQSVIVTDYEAFQVFADYQHAVTYRRLPWSLVPGEDRYFPRNKSLVAEWIQGSAKFLASASDKGKSDLLELTKDSWGGWRILADNGSVWTVARSGPCEIGLASPYP